MSASGMPPHPEPQSMPDAGPSPFPGQRSPRPARRTGAGWWILGILFLVGGGLFTGLLVLAGIGASLTSGEGGPDGLLEKTMEAGSGFNAPKIAVISISGVIEGGGTRIDGDGLTHKVGRALRKAREDDKVRAVILQIDSPGGGLHASDLLHEEVRRLKATKPVVTLVGDLAASGGYYIAAPTDWIVAGPTSLVGSIGVILERFQIDGLLDKIGVRVEPFKSCTLKDIGSPFRDMTEGEKKILQELIAQAHSRFVEVVAEGRKLASQDAAACADGRIFTSREALDRKLVDEIGYFDAALNKAMSLAQIPATEKPRLVSYQPAFSLSSLLEAAGPTVAPRAGAWISELEGRALSPRLRAIWTAGDGR